MRKHIHVHIHRTFDAFVESEHPRGQPGNPGEFAKASGGTTTQVKAPSSKPQSPQRATPPSTKPGSPRASGASHLPGGTKTKTTMLPLTGERDTWPEHIRKLRIPPAWTNLKYNPDPSGALLVTGHDAGGRRQPLYKAEYRQKRDADKYKRIRVIAKNFPTYKKTNTKNLNSRDARVREHAEALGLIMETGIRPGSERDTGAAVQAYGVTTIQGHHVVSEGNKVYLRFIGKKGVDQNIEIENKELADAVKARAKKVGLNNKIFPDIDDNTLRRYTQKLTNNKANPKDFRTLLGTSMAADLVKSMPIPEGKRATKKAMNQVAEKVSDQLGNEMAQCLKSYIAPYVWKNAGWAA